MKKTFFLFLVLVFLGELNAQDPDISKIPKYLGASNFGTEFWVTIPPCFEDESGNPLFIEVFVTSQVEATVTVEVPRKSFKEIQQTKPNNVIEFNIYPGVGQPYEKSGSGLYVPEQIFVGAGIHVSADQPVACYVVVRYTYTSDGFLAIPVSSLGQEYIVAGYKEEGMYGSQYKLPSTTGIIAAFDETMFRFTLGGNPNTKTAGSMVPGESIVRTLQKGDVWMVSTSGGDQDLSGSKIESNKPVSVISGNFCTDIPTGNKWCDYTVEMELPTMTWGKNYIVPKIPNRKYSSIIRVFAKERGTKVFRNGTQIATLDSSGGIEGKAFIELRMNPMDQPPASISISADKPIGVTLYNTGTEEDSNNVSSDPFVMAISPVEQFQKEILFCTPGIGNWQKFKYNYLNFVYESDSAGTLSDQFEFGTSIDSIISWEKLKDKFSDTCELIKSPVDSKFYGVKTLTLPKDGVYMIRSDSLLFSAYSFGYSDYESYGYPAAVRLRDMTKPDTEKPKLDFIDMIKYGYAKGSATDMPDDPKIRSNLGLIVFHKDLSSNCKFTHDTFIPGNTRTVTWRVDVLDLSLPTLAVISFYDRCGNDTTVVLKYDSSTDPLGVHLLLPLNMTENLPDSSLFIWNKSVAQMYRLIISEDRYEQKNALIFDLTDTMKNVSGLKNNTTYFWQVQNILNDTILGRSSIWKFTTGKINSVAYNYPENGFSMNPNPASDFIEISVGANGCSPLQNDVRIFNIYGQTVSTVNSTPTLPASREGVRIDVSGLAPGMYFVRMGDKVGKFVKY